MNPARGVVRRLGSRRWFAALGRRALHHVDRATFAVARRTVSGAVLPTLVLETAGRRTGRVARTPLLYARDGDAFVVIASAWGQRAHPDWSANLLARPSATLTAGGVTLRVDASLAHGSERERLLTLLHALWPAYDVYVEWARDRRIRVFVLRPLS